nr:immunoglobulin light chain junction region [Macaca mulatta]
DYSCAIGHSSGDYVF